MDSEFDELLKEWKKYFSKSRQREYYFNSRTKDSLWTLDAAKDTIRRELETKSKDNPDKKLFFSSDKQNAGSSASKAETEHSIVNCKSVIWDTHENLEMSIDDDEDTHFYVPMDIDEIVENINEIRKDKELHSASSLNNLNIDKNNNNKSIELNKLKIILVLDTNIFISNLEKLNELFKSEFKSKILFSVPWVVLQELDKLKDDKKYDPSPPSSMSYRARKAINFISKILESDSGNNFVFENAIQSQESTIMKCDTNDDKILKCALRSKSIYSNLLVVLVTNDKNLINKSIVSNIRSYSFDTLSTKLAELIQNEPNSRLESINESAGQACVNASGSILKGTQFEYTEKIVNGFMDSLLDLVESQLSSILFKSLCLFYEIKMKKAYSDTWMDMLLHKPPWTLQTFLPNLKKSYQALFCFVNESRTMNAKFESLISLLNELNKLNYESNTNRLNKLNTSIRTSSELKSIYNLLKINEEYSKNLNELNKCLDYFESCAIKLTRLYHLTQTFHQTPDIYINLNLNSTPSIDFKQFFEPIWLKLNDMSMLAANIQSEHIFESFQLNDSQTYFYFIISYKCLEHFRQSYENFLRGENENNSLLILTYAIFVLLKLFDVRYLEDTREEKEKFIFIKASMLKCFLPEFNETMYNGLNQLKEFQNRFRINEKYFCNLNKYL